MHFKESTPIDKRCFNRKCAVIVASTVVMFALACIILASVLVSTRSETIAPTSTTAPLVAQLCMCVDAEKAPVLEDPCGTLIKEHTFGACWISTLESVECDGKTFVQVAYGPQKIAWISRDDVNQAQWDKCSGSGGSCSNVQFVSREEWGARPPKNTSPFKPPMSMVFVHHSAMTPCYNAKDCEAMAKRIQDLHMDSNGWDDVGYNFLVGQDGRVYEGRGWTNQPAQAKSHNTYSYGICLMGDFTRLVPVPIAQQAVKDMIDCGIQQGHITIGHEEFGHRDGVCTECPGNTFYPVLQTWPRYSTRDIPISCGRG